MPQQPKHGARRWLGSALVLGALAAVLVAEHRRPLRRETQGKLGRDLTNMTLAALNAATLQALERPVVPPLARMVEQHRWGLVPQLQLPAPLNTAAAVLLMDYTFYLWHVWAHRAPLLWRLHAVHHVDLDMSATTALRFHFAEMVVSVPYRAAQVLLIGTSPRALTLWQDLMFASIVFHHSNLRLPEQLERALARVIVTPRMHGIHHSVVQEERDSNWSSGLTIWDRLHGTLKLDVPQEEISIGIPGHGRPEDASLARSLALPFQDAPAAGSGKRARRPDAVPRSPDDARSHPAPAGEANPPRPARYGR